MHPQFRVSGLEGQGSFTGPGGRALALTVIQEITMMGWEFNVVLDDREDEGILVIPNGWVRVEMGYQETGLFDMGAYYIDEVTLEGWPRTMKVHGLCMNPAAGPATPRDQDYNNMTGGKLVQTIAKDNGWIVRQLPPAFANHQYTHVSQGANESDRAFLTRIALEWGATFTIGRNNEVLVSQIGAGLPGMGVALQGNIARYPDNVLHYVCIVKPAMYPDGANANAYDPKSGEPQTKHSPAGPAAMPEDTGGHATDTAGDTGGHAPEALAGAFSTQKSSHTDKKTATDTPQQAQQIATGNANEQAVLSKKLSIDLIGDPTMGPLQPLKVMNVRPIVDDTYIVYKCIHAITSETGYRVHIDGEWQTLGRGDVTSDTGGHGGTGAATDTGGHAVDTGADTGGHAPGAIESAGG